MGESPDNRSKKQCRLTDLGLRLLEGKISKLDRKQQSNNSLATECGCDRGTISKIRNGPGAVVHSKLCDLFSVFNLDLEDKHWEEWESKADDLQLNQTIKQSAKLPHTVNLPTKTQQKIVDLLWTLNCRAQENDFQSQCQSSLQRSHLFVVQAPDPRIQKWLVKRLILQYHNAQPYSLNVRSHPMRVDFNAFWEEIKSRLKLSTTASPDVVLQCLCEMAQTKPVFIAVFGLHRSQETRDNFLEQFWLPLSQKFCAQPTKSFKAKLVLFLIEEPQTSPLANWQDFCHLPPLTEITAPEVEAWLETVHPFFSQAIGEDRLEHLVQIDLPQWGTQPAQVIDEVCCAIQLKNGIADIESYWELAG